MLKISIEGGTFKDTLGREVVLRGINFAADAKLPAVPYTPSHAPDNDDFYKGDDVSFVGSPFALSEADSHLERLRAWGFNTVRYIFTWEALEHQGPDIYDEEFIQFTIQILYKLKEYGFYVIMDPHQDCWARYCGGSGAPLWTLYAVGLNPRTFKATQAALLENHFANNAEERPQMLWASNYTRLAASTLFTLFFAGKTYAPKCILNGVNIQDYLESHFINACRRLAERIYTADESGEYGGLTTCILGWESMNEPGHGYIGIEDLTEIPKSQQVKLYTTPTGAQSMALGAGIPQHLPRYEFTTMGPKVADSRVLVDPKGSSAWLSPEQLEKYDEHYGWKRGPDWEGGKCIWNQHGVWKATDNNKFTILRPDYFSYDLNGTLVDHNRFVDEVFTNHWLAYKKSLRQVAPHDSFMFFQPPVLASPPDLKSRGLVDKYMVYSPHYYDGLTLMLKHWNRNFNVDAMGVIRGKYANPPVMAIRLGERNIRRCLGEQLRTLKQEGIDAFGADVPCMITEIGVPYDMDKCEAYRTGDFSSQARSMDANNHALEYARLSHTLWVYTAHNSNIYGDGWNGEDLSIWSTDLVKNAETGPPEISTAGNSLISRIRSRSSTKSSETSSTSSPFHSSNGDVSAMDSDPANFISPSSGDCTTLIQPNISNFHDPYKYLPGARAPEAFIRPVPVSVAGKILSYNFNMHKSTFTLKLIASGALSTETKADGDCDISRIIPTIIFIPTFHFPVQRTGVYTSAGIWKIDRVNQLLYWWHLKGPQQLQLNGQLRPSSDLEDEDAVPSSQTCSIA